MSNEVKVDEVVTEVLEAKVEEKSHDRGVLGTGTPSSRLKNLHAQTGRGLSLKTFVKDQAAAGNKDAVQWVAAKKGKLNAKRSAAALARITVEKNATKLARRSKKNNGNKQADSSKPV